MMRTVCVLLFVLFPLLINANIWDNLFLGQGVSFRLPKDFVMELAVQQDFGKATFKLTGSSSLNCLSISQGIEIKDAGDLVNFMTKTGLLDYKMNFTAGTLNVHSLVKDCIAVQDDKFEADFYQAIQDFIDIGTLLISREEEDGFYKLDAKKLVEMVNIKKIKDFNLKDLPLDKIPTEGLPIDKLDLNKLDTENYASKIPQLVFYFDKQSQNLKRIQVNLPNDEKYSLEVISIESREFTPQDFQVPKAWNCDREKAKPLHELDVEEILKDIQEKNGSTLNLLKTFLPEGWAIPDLNKLMNQFKALLALKNDNPESSSDSENN